MEQRQSLLTSVRKGDAFRTRAYLERMKGSAARVINSTKDPDGINLLCIAVKKVRMGHSRQRHEQHLNEDECMQRRRSLADI